MGENSKIEWTDHTFNPWVGCQKVGPPCDNCYAEGWAKRSGMVEWGPHAERRRTSEANWNKPFKWNVDAGKAGERRRVFCASLADWLDNQAPYSWRLALALVIETTPNLDWLLLTKRISNFEQIAPWTSSVPSNVWLGISCGDQGEFDRDYIKLANIPAPVHFISYEPALGPLSIRESYPFPDWIICGGESGSKARYMQPQWARDLRDECSARSVPFFMKQMTRKAPIPDDLMVRQFPRSAVSNEQQRP